MEIFKLTKNQFFTLYYKEELCLEYLASIKWKDGFVCKNCSHEHFCVGTKPFSRRCTRCKKQETAKANTIFHSCKLPLHVVFELMYYIWNSNECKTSILHNKYKIRQMTCWKFQNLVKTLKQTNQILLIN